MTSILWRRLDSPGHDAARLRRMDALWQLDGAAVFGHQGKPCRLDYVVTCDESWRTMSAHVSGSLGNEAIDLRICPEVDGCTDVDLNFSPSTNLLPIRRLNLSVGAEAKVRAAWLRFPGFALEPLEQVYRRVSDDRYGYESNNGFVSELRVDRSGLVIEYPHSWSAEMITS